MSTSLDTVTELRHMKKPFVMAVLAYLVPTFMTGYVWHLVVFHDAYVRLDIYRADVIIPFGFGSMLLQALFFAWAYPRLFSTRRQDWVKSAALSGLAFAALSWSFTTLAVAAKNQMASVPDYLMIETGFTLLQFVLVAPLIALAYREVKEVRPAGSQVSAA
jgi:hypothetical protein